MKVSRSERQRLKACTCLHKQVIFKVKGSRTKRYLVGTVTDEVAVIDNDYKHLLQRIELPTDLRKKWGSRYLIRSAYYTLKARTRIPAWGQFHATMREQVFRSLIRKAHQKKWL